MEPRSLLLESGVCCQEAAAPKALIPHVTINTTQATGLDGTATTRSDHLGSRAVNMIRSHGSVTSNSLHV